MYDLIYISYDAYVFVIMYVYKYRGVEKNVEVMIETNEHARIMEIMHEQRLFEDYPAKAHEDYRLDVKPHQCNRSPISLSLSLSLYVVMHLSELEAQ